MNFSAFNLHRQIETNIDSLGYETPTPIQQQSIPAILSGKDVMGLAQTGTGKTAAFVLPILHKLLNGPRVKIRALILAPTRELAQQIDDTITSLSTNTRLRSLTLYGGVNINPQIKALHHGIDIAVACPGRLLDLIERRAIDLSAVQMLVLDEADQMFDMGFLPGIRKILRALPKVRQTLLFSATMPEAINTLARDVLHHPITVQIGHTAPATSVNQILFPIEKHLKTNLLIKLLQLTKTESVLVFTRTKHTAKKVAQKLEAAGFPAAALQGNLSQNNRTRVMTGFRDGSLQILVATDIASRGIDVSQISHVINYDIPSTVETYIHRIGRTGRMTRLGEAFTFTTHEDTSMVRDIERALKRKLDLKKLDDFDYAEKAPTPAPGTPFRRPEKRTFRPQRARR